MPETTADAAETANKDGRNGPSPGLFRDVPEQPSSGRLYHFDAVRSFCLVYGFFVHAAPLDTTGQFWFVGGASGFFRMAAFFLVSGYFGAMLVSRMGAAAFFRKRTLNLLVPLTAGVILLNPATIYLMYIYYNGFVSPVDITMGDLLNSGARPTHWQLHLWFLFSLLVYVMLTPLMMAIVGLPTLRRSFAKFNTLQPGIRLVVLAICAGVSVTAGLGFYVIALEKTLDGTSFSHIAQNSINYMPFYMIGIMSFVHPCVYKALHHVSWSALLLCAFAAAVLIFAADNRPDDRAGQVLYHISKNTITLISVAIICTCAKYIFYKKNILVDYVGQRIYTGYIFHLTVIYLLAVALKSADISPIIQFLLISIATLVIVFWLHGHVIMRFPVLQLLFNGRLVPPAEPDVPGRTLVSRT